MVRGGGAGVARGGGTVMLAVGGLLVSVCVQGSDSVSINGQINQSTNQLIS